MIYRKIKICNHSLLNQLDHDVYELSNREIEREYSTAPNGIIGISIVLEVNTKLFEKKNGINLHQLVFMGLLIDQM